MDVNGTRFHLVLGEQDWLADAATSAATSGIVWDPVTRALGLAPEPFLYPQRSIEPPPTRDQRRGAARDRFGNWYWVDDDRTRIRFLGAGASQPESFWSGDDETTLSSAPLCVDPTDAGGFIPCVAAPVQVSRLFTSLAVTEDHYLVAASAQPKGLLVFDLRAGGPPMRLAWPDEVSFSPIDMVAAPDGGFRILDASGPAFWVVDRYFRVRGPKPVSSIPASGGPAAGDFVLATGGRAALVSCAPSTRIDRQMALPVAIGDPIAIEALPDGSVVVLGRYGTLGAAVARYQTNTTGMSTDVVVLADESATLVPPALSVLLAAGAGTDFAFVPIAGGAEGMLGRLLVVAADGNQAFEFALRITTDGAGGTRLQLRFGRGFSAAQRTAAAFYPMRRFGGKALVAAGSGAYYDADLRWLPLVEQPQPLFVGRGSIVLPAAGAPAFDGHEPGCVWHRLFIDGCIPPGGAVRIESRAADRLDELEQQPWDEEPMPYLRGDGAEIPFHDTSPASVSAPQREGTWELLFQRAHGRYLQLRLTLDGTRRSTPRLRTLRIYYPRFSYLDRYLPAVYAEEPLSASFVERYLANTEGQLTVLEGRIASAQTLFDTRTAPSSTLEWLAEWFGIVLDPAWSEATRRLYLAHAPQMLRERGTRAGLIRALRLALEPCVSDSLFDCADGSCGASAGQAFGVRIVERFLTRGAPGVVFGDPTDVAGPGASTNSLDWTPVQGAEPLHLRWRGWLATRYADAGALNARWGTSFTTMDDPALRLASTAPNGAAGEDWRRFVSTALGFTYVAPGADDLGRWRDFLARRYSRPGDLNRAYGWSGGEAIAAFTKIAFPSELPAGGAALRDWIQFVSVALPTHRNAHRFTVLVPVGLDDDPETQRTRLEIARRVAEAEKPAHTAFEVRAYWAAFRVGEARLGLDTPLGRGSRFAAIQLGRALLGAAHLDFPESWRAGRRVVLGRDRVRWIARAAAKTPSTRPT